MTFSRPIQLLGQSALDFVYLLGRMGLFLGCALAHIVLPPYKHQRVINQIFFIGVKTVSVVALTGLFTGMVSTLQVYYVLVTFGAESRLGAIIALSLIRELGPVISALMVIGRAGSALTAELGIMRITEQIDAIEAMALNPFKYLISPNIIAAVISLPILNALFIIIGIWGGYLVGVELTGLSSGTYFNAITDSVLLKDILLSFYKSLAFGLLIAWICCFKGFFAGHHSDFGAQGVSRSMTKAVVQSSVCVLICDYFITSIMMF